MALEPSFVTEYNRLLEADPWGAAEQSEMLVAGFRERGILFAGSPMASFLRPHFVERRQWAALRADGRRLLELAARVARKAFHGDVARLASYLGIPESHARWIRPDRGEPDVLLSRLDAFLTPEGPRFVEINSDAPAGFGYGDRMAEVFASLPVFQAFARRFPVQYQASSSALVDAILGLWQERGSGGSPTVAIVDFPEVRTLPDQEILREAFGERGVRCVLADPRRMRVGRGRLWDADTAVDVVYRRAVLTELVEREDEVREFLEAYEQGLALCVNPFRCRLSEDKGFFALLADEHFAHLLSEADQDFIGARVPWTRRLAERRTRRGVHEVDLVPYVLENRMELVLKPAYGYGGRSVFVGSETEPDAWSSAVEQGLDESWVVQERVPIPEERFPVFDGERLDFEWLKVNANPFYVRGAEVGAVTRASRSSVINVSAGGGSIPTFVVD